MNLLVVMAYYPFPLHAGGELVAYNNIKELSKKHSIYILCRSALKVTGELSMYAEQTRELSMYVEQIEFVNPNKIPRIVQILRKALYLLLRIPTFVTECMSYDMKKRVRELLEQHKFDAILLYNMNSIQYCPNSSYKKVIINIEDPQSIRLARLRKLPIWYILQKLKLDLDTKMIARFENKYLPKMAKVLLLSEADSRDMKEQGEFNVGTVSYGINNHFLRDIIRYEGRTKGMILFSGNMFHSPNVDGALFFLKHIFPMVLKDYSSAILWIVGSEPDNRIRDASACFGEHVVITGRVNDMSEYLRYAMVSICPVRLKIGVQTKILEALSWGTPVVSTSAGNSGIGGFSGSELWVEDEPNIFASRVVELLRGEGWQKLSVEGRKLVEEHFSWEQSALKLEQHIMSIQTTIN
jgi:polysaccharide biosynthesis protein PslH